MITSFDIIEPRAARVRRWVAAGFLVLALHVGGATAALWQSQHTEMDDEPEGALLMELAAIAVAPPDEPQNLALGTPAEDSVATPATEEVKEVKTEEDLPQIDETPLVDNPEVVLEKIKPVELKELPEEKQVQEYQVQTVASVAAAPPPIEAAVTGPNAAAQYQGSSRKPNAVEITWQKALFLHISKFKRYPAQAQDQRLQGVVTVSFAIDDKGNVSNARVFKGSGMAMLDAEALEILRRASPLPAPPAEDGALKASRKLALPIQFNIR